jgi:two-component system CheB/CheR fusion protein
MDAHLDRDHEALAPLSPGEPADRLGVAQPITPSAEPTPSPMGGERAAVEAVAAVEAGGTVGTLDTTVDSIAETRERFAQRQDALARATAQLLWVATADGLIEEDSPSWRAYTGQTREQMQAWGWLEAVHPNDRERAGHAWAHALTARAIYATTYRLHRADGAYRTFAAHAVPIMAADGTVREWIGACADISDQVLQERALLALLGLPAVVATSTTEAGVAAAPQDAAHSLEYGAEPNPETQESERAQSRSDALPNEVLDEFLSLASHELRTPLTTIKASVQLCLRQVKSLLARRATPARAAKEATAATAADDLDEALGRVRRLLERGDLQACRLNRLVDDLLDASRLRAGTFAVRRERCDLLAIVRRAVDEQRTAWPNRIVECVETLALPSATDLAATDPAELPARTLIVTADARRIGQVVTHLLTNALKYAPADRAVRVTVTVEGEGEPRARVVRVAVSDKGPGLTPEQQARIWQRFYRASGVMQQEGPSVGLGLGLYISRAIIARLM